jgi:hypothetical protein
MSSKLTGTCQVGEDVAEDEYAECPPKAKNIGILLCYSGSNGVYQVLERLLHWTNIIDIDNDRDMIVIERECLINQISLESSSCLHLHHCNCYFHKKNSIKQTCELSRHTTMQHTYSRRRQWLSSNSYLYQQDAGESPLGYNILYLVVF